MICRFYHAGFPIRFEQMKRQLPNGFGKNFHAGKIGRFLHLVFWDIAEIQKIYKLLQSECLRGFFFFLKDSNGFPLLSSIP